MDKRWYLDINSFARSTPWAHHFMTAYFGRLLAPVGGGLILLALIALAGWWSARRHPGCMTAAVWAVLGAGVALGLDELLVRVLAKPFPFQQIHKVQVLVPMTSGHVALPAVHPAVAAAVVCGLALSRRWRLAAIGAVASVLLAFSGVYVGADYPSDVAAGLGFGLAVSLVLWPLGSWLAGPAVDHLSHGRLAWLVVSRKAVGRPSRGQVVIPRPAAARLPNAKAMDALRVASEAAKNAPSLPPTPALTSIRTQALSARSSPEGVGVPDASETT